MNFRITVLGERYDFVINANNKVDSYWIQLRGIASCKNNAIQQLAVLQYEGAASNTLSNSSAPTLNAPLPEGIVSCSRICSTRVLHQYIGQ